MKDYHSSIADKNLKYLEQVRIPNSLFHYSNQQVCHSIRSSSCLRAYELFSMKDKNEFWLGVELFELMARRKNLRGHMDGVVDFVRKEIQRKIQFYLTCFTSSATNRKHWKTYGNWFQGECLEFDKREIKLNLQHHKLGPNGVVMNTFQISPVNYCRNYQEYKLNSLIEDYKKLHDEIFILHGQNGRQQIGQLLLGVFQNVVVLSTLYKQKKFSWEEEYRGLISFTTGYPICCSSGRLYIELDATPK